MREKIFTLLHNPKVQQFLRFCIIGVCASLVHYGLYYLLMSAGVEVNISYTVGYLVSFVGNFYATNYFTFRTLPSWRRFLGFAGSHGINYVVHIVLLNLFLWLGINKVIAPVLVMGVAMLIQFFILRFVFTTHAKK